MINVLQHPINVLRLTTNQHTTASNIRIPDSLTTTDNRTQTCNNRPQTAISYQLSNILSNNNQPQANDQRPSTADQRPSAANQRPLADNQPPHNVGDRQANASNNTALNNSACTMQFTPHNRIDIPGAFRSVEIALVTAMENLLRQHRNFRGYITLEATYSRLYNGAIVQHQQLFRSQTLIFSNQDDIEQNLAEMMREIFERSQEFQTQGSGWILDSVVLLTLCAVKYHPLRGSSYIRLPKEIELTRSVLNIRNTDQRCARLVNFGISTPRC